MNWRSKEWDKNRRKTILLENVALDEIFEAGADAMLDAVCEEIEKVENPYKDLLPPEYEGGFEEARQNILALLKEINDGS